MLETKTASQKNMNRDLLNLREFGVCHGGNELSLLEQGYLESYSRWFKPINGALNYFVFTQKGHEYVLAL